MKRNLVWLLVAAAAASAQTLTKDSLAAMKPAQAIERLKQGNGRFLAGAAAPRDLKAQVKATASGQYPFAAILSCMDSRVPPEIVFDQGIGTSSASAWRATSSTRTTSGAWSTRPRSWGRS